MLNATLECLGLNDATTIDSDATFADETNNLFGAEKSRLDFASEDRCRLRQGSRPLAQGVKTTGG